MNDNLKDLKAYEKECARWFFRRDFLIPDREGGH